jgi:hypothetical protein
MLGLAADEEQLLGRLDRAIAQVGASKRESNLGTFPEFGTGVRVTPRWREVNSNFPYRILGPLRFAAASLLEGTGLGTWSRATCGRRAAGRV